MFRIGVTDEIVRFIVTPMAEFVVIVVGLARSSTVGAGGVTTVIVTVDESGG